MENTENNRPNNGHGRDARGRFINGNSGRPFGAPKNQLRDQIKDFLNDNWKDFPTWFKALKPLDKVHVILDLLPFAVSRLKTRVDLDGNDLPAITFQEEKTYLKDADEFKK